MKEDFQEAVKNYKQSQRNSTHIVVSGYYDACGVYVGVTYDFMERIRIIVHKHETRPTVLITPFKELDRDVLEAIYEKLQASQPNCPPLPVEQASKGVFNRNNNGPAV